MRLYTLPFLSIVLTCAISTAQNVGIGITTPLARLHIKGNADTSQLVIDAGATQSNARPLIRLRNAAGADLMHIHTDAEFNVFMGFAAGRSNTVNIAGQHGLFNSFIGSNAGFYNTTGSFNTAVGRSSLYQNNVGVDNTGVGFKSLFSNTIGTGNTGVGSGALNFNIEGSNNTAIGREALFHNNTGYNNVAIGNRALYANTNSDNNTAIGYFALNNQSFNNGGISWAGLNTAVGYAALFQNNPTSATNGINNTAIGGYALMNNISGSENTAVGVLAGNASNASYNSFFGARAGYKTASSGNTAIGQEALHNTTSGYWNVALGWEALETNITGIGNTAVGTGADVDLSNTNYNTLLGVAAHANGSNNTLLGYGAYTNGNNVALLGSTTTAFCGGYTNWTNFASDARIKANVHEDVKGLEFILRLRPVTYNLNVRSIYNLWGISPYGKQENTMTASMRTDMNSNIRNKEAIRTSGFIAQEVEKAAQETGYDFDGIKKPENDKDHYGLTYATFVVPLVKAVQEQQKIIEDKQKQIDELTLRLEKLEQRIIK